MIDDEKGYKKVMDEKYKIYFKMFSDDLKNASRVRDNPKHFWKILGGHKRKQQPNIEIIDERGNFIILDINIQDYRMTLVAMYGPNEDNPDCFLKLVFILI